MSFYEHLASGETDQGISILINVVRVLIHDFIGYFVVEILMYFAILKFVI